MKSLCYEGYFAFCLLGNTPRVTSLEEVSKKCHICGQDEALWCHQISFWKESKGRIRSLAETFSLGKFRGEMDKVIFRKDKIIRSEFIMF